MALRNLSTETMLALSGAWLEQASPARRLLETIPLAAALLPRLEAAHTKLLAHEAQATGERLPAAIEAIREEELVVDLRHDKKARGVYLALSAFAELADSNEEAAAIVDLRELLFPRGTSIVTRPYLEEAGEARLVRERVNAEVRALLATLPSVSGRSLASEVDAWITAGHALGALETERGEAEAALAASPLDTSARSIGRTRTAWIRVVTAIVDNLALEEELDLELEAHVLAPLRNAETAADRRADGKRTRTATRKKH